MSFFKVVPTFSRLLNRNFHRSLPSYILSFETWLHSVIQQSYELGPVLTVFVIHVIFFVGSLSLLKNSGWCQGFLLQIVKKSQVWKCWSIIFTLAEMAGISWLFLGVICYCILSVNILVFSHSWPCISWT
jgi:hypothetical protein